MEALIYYKCRPSYCDITYKWRPLIWFEKPSILPVIQAGNFPESSRKVTKGCSSYWSGRQRAFSLETPEGTK
jgi:hypothetical protein